MKKRSVNVKVNYKTGQYIAYGTVNGKKIMTSKPISGVDNDGYYKRSFSSELIEYRREQMEEDIEKVLKLYPNLKYSRKQLNNADPLMYKLLKEWDRNTGGDYALDYLRSVIEQFDDNEFKKSSKDTLEEKSKRVRMNNLKKSGIKITYEGSFFDLGSRLSLFEKIRCYRFAKQHEKMFGVKIKKNSLLSILKNKTKDLKKESGRWVRSLKSKKDSIYNKKYVPDKKETQKRVIKGVATALAASSIFLNIGVVNHVMSKHRESLDNDLVFAESIKANDRNVNYNKENVVLVDFDKIDLGNRQYESPKKLSDKSKTEENKIDEFKKYAVEKYMDEFTIGSKPEVGDMLDFYTENPDGSGNIGYFKTHPNSKISYINVVTKDGTQTIRENGESLNDILDKYSEYTDYSIHFEDSETGGWLGFVTKSHLDLLVEQKVNSIIESKQSQISNSEYDELLK